MKLYSIKEASDLLGMSESWLDKKIREKAINVVWLGGIRKISEDEIKRITKKGVK
jgi:excisionase family DNA binding protein